MSAQTKAGGPILSKPRERSELDFNELPLAESAGATFPSTVIDRDPGFRVWKRIDGSVDVSGEVDFCTAESFRAALSAVTPSSGIALISMRGLQFIDSAGIRAIVSTARSFPTVELRLTSPKSTFVKCWDLLGCSALASNVKLCQDIRGQAEVA
jgi:anti-anti-sigma factor